MLSGLSQADLMLIQEYLCLRETGLDMDTAYSFMDGRHERAQKAMIRLQEEYAKQEQAQRDQKPLRVKSKATRPYASAKEYLTTVLQYREMVQIDMPASDCVLGETQDFTSDEPDWPD
jgi:hypothetical protein